MRMISRIAAVAAVLLSVGSATGQEKAPGVVVTQETYCRAETDRTFNNATKLAGGVNRFFHFRAVTPLDNQTVVRMNRDTLYSAAIVDTSKRATITVPKMPAGRYCSVLLIDNDHYCPGVIYDAGTHPLPEDTKYLGVLVRIQLLKPTDPEDVALVNKLQDQFVIEAGSADPFPVPKWDAASLEKLTAAYKAKFDKYEKYPDGFMAARGKADEKLRHLACAGAWGLFPNEHAVYINYNGRLPPAGHHTATYNVPENNAFWSITVYGADGYMKSENSILNKFNTKMNEDGTFTVHFGSKEDCGDVPNRLDVSDGWNFLMRVYRPGKSVLDGSYKLPDVTQSGQPLPTTGTTESRIGPLAFEGGYPTDATVTKLYDEMDFQRATQAYIWAMPIVSFAKWQEQHEQVFGQEDGDLVQMASSRDKMGMLTPNDSTTYLLAYLNLERTGPLVVDYPKGPTAGAVLDMWQRPITDMGLSGPDKGEGGKYLLVPPGQKAPKDAEGYRVFESPTNNIFYGLRILTTDPKQAESLKTSYQVYPYAKRDNPRKTRIIPVDGKKWTGWPQTGLEFWQLASKMLNEEPVHERDRMMVAMLKPLGIEKGKKFEPDARQKRILEQGAVVGEAMARANTYASREKEAKLWGPDNQWKLIILCAANQETKYHTALDERSAYFYEAVTLSDGMTTKTPGVGQAYMGIRKDKDGQWLQGDKNYTLRVPPNAPAKQFWALTLYDTETRSFIDTKHDIAGLDSRKDLVKNADGSVDLYIGPEAPNGKETNWIPTAPGRGWFGLFRLYAPTEAYFDRSWKLPDLVHVK